MQHLDDVTVIEFAGIGPAPFAATYLERLGATVVRIDRPGGHGLPGDLGTIGRRQRASLALDLKDAAHLAIAGRIADGSDVLIEGFRPGVMERLGLGPDDLHATNPGLVYARLTGWGSDGPYASMAGHDINYIGLVGVLDAIGPSATPMPPLNLVGDYAGGSLFAVIGILSALHARSRNGTGAVIDASIIDGAAALLEPIRDLLSVGMWRLDRSANLLDGGAPFYRCYATSDGGHMAVGALEPQFYSAFVEGLGLVEADLEDRMDPSNWPVLAERFAARFAEADRAAWTERFDGVDACVTPVLSMAEAPGHPHNAARATIAPADVARPPAPRFAGDEGGEQPDLVSALGAVGIPASEAQRLIADGLAGWS